MCNLCYQKNLCSRQELQEQHTVGERTTLANGAPQTSTSTSSAPIHFLLDNALYLNYPTSPSRCSTTATCGLHTCSDDEGSGFEG